MRSGSTTRSPGSLNPAPGPAESNSSTPRSSERFEGQGLGGRSIPFALDDARERGLEVLPFCPFVRDYMEHHPEYIELVPEKLRARFELDDRR